MIRYVEEMMNEKVVFVSCVSKKEEQPQPAGKLYISSWFKKAAAFARREGDRWYILSAKHGLLPPPKVIAPYDVTLNNMKAPERRAWAEKVVTQIKSYTNPDDELVFLAGNRYREYLVEPLREAGYKISIPMEGLRIGEQLSWLNERIQT
jgi:cytoplasmic iron level regulating protein YaaA (DUF328/UPF0246 family)